MTPEQRRGQQIVWWMLWCSFQLGVAIIYHFLSAPLPPRGSPVEAGVGPWMLALIPLAISVVLRWLVLPRIRSGQRAFPFFLMGISTAESATFLGIFIFPEYRLHLFGLSFLGILQFIPLYLDRFDRDDEADGLRQRLE